MSMKWLAATVVLLSASTGTTACGSTAPVDTSCGEGKGHWIEDDNNWVSSKTHVTVRICVDDGGNVIDLEVN